MSYNPVPSLNNGNATFNNDVNVSGISRLNAGVKTKLNTELDGVTITFDMNESNSHTAELGGNRSLAVSNVDAGQKFSLRLKQDTTGSREVTWWNNISWMSVDGSEPTLRTSGVDYFGFVCTSGGYYEGFHLTEASTGGGGGGTVNNVASGLPYSSGEYYLEQINVNSTNIATVSGLLTPSGESFSFSTNTLTYNNSDGGSFSVDLSSLSGGGGASGLPYASGDYYLQEIRANSASGLANANDIITVSGLIGAGGLPYSSGDYYLNSINTVSGLIPPNTFNITGGDGSNYTIDGMGLNSASDPTMYIHKGHTYVFNKTFSGHPFRVSNTDGGSVYSDADGNAIEIGSSAGSVTFEVPQDAPDKLYYYCTAHPSTMKGVIYTTTDGATSGYFESRVDSADTNISTNSSSITANSGYFESRVDSADSIITANSGYFESRVDQADTDIATVSGLLYDDAAISGYFESRVDSADTNISTNSSSITANSGHFESRVDQNAADIVTVSGLTGSSSLTVRDIDGTPSVSNVTTIEVTNGSLTDQGGGVVRIATSGGGGGGGTTYTAGSGLSLVGTEFNVYGGSGNFEYIELQTDNTTIPKFKFTGSGVTDTPISLEVASSFESASSSGSALLFQGTQGQLFSITDNLSSGTIFNVSDITGLPMLEVDASGHVQIGEFADDITIHQPILLSGGVPTSTTNKLYNNAGTLYFNGSAVGAGGGGGGLPYSSGDYYLQEIRSNSASGVAISGYFESRVNQSDSDIATVSGLLYDDTAISGYFESRVNQSDSDIATVSGLLYDDTAISGYFESRASQDDTDIAYISGIAVYASGLDNYLLNPSGTDGIAITSTPDTVIFSGDATLARVSDLNALSGVATSQTLQTITDNGSTTSNDITLNSNLTAEYILAELDGPIVFECKNSTGAQIDAGTPVYVSGYFSGNGKPLIAPARSDDPTKMPAIGVLESDLAHDTEGYVNSFGRVQQIDTSSFTVGNTVYVSPSGGLTNARPSGIGELVQNMGKVLRSDASQGRILLLGPGRTNDVPNSGEFKELTVDGHFSAVTKSFLIDHPSREGAKLQYASLEGPENGVYVRGTTKETFITLPDYWRDLVHNNSITVTLTSVGSFQPLFVESKSNREIIVGGVCGYYDYVVWGERKDVAKLEVEW